MAFGILHTNTRIIFEKKPVCYMCGKKVRTCTFILMQESTIQLIGRAIGDSAHTALISPDWDFKQMGIGGLDKEFSDIFRRAFASRVFPPDVVEQMGMKHVRGILLYGPPGELPYSRKFLLVQFSYIWPKIPQNKFSYVLILHARATRPHPCSSPMAYSTAW